MNFCSRSQERCAQALIELGKVVARQRGRSGNKVEENPTLSENPILSEIPLLKFGRKFGCLDGLCVMCVIRER